MSIHARRQSMPWPNLSATATFVLASVSLTLVFVAAGAPIPLYNLYRAESGITNADLGWVSVGYFVAAAMSLLVLGRLSNHLGRKPVAVAALVGGAMSCVILLAVRNVWPLALGRVLQGMSCGLASSAIGAYIVDTAPAKPRWLPAAITSSAPMLGIPIGAFISGALAQFGSSPRTTVFEVVGVLLAVAAFLTVFGPETMHRNRGVFASMRPRLQVPVGSGRVLVAAGAVFVATWSIGGFYQAFGPSVVAERLGTASPLAAAAAFASVMMLTPISGPLSGRLDPTLGLRAGMALFIATLVGIVVSLHTGVLWLFLVSSLLVGVAQGAASTGGVRELLAAASPERRAGVLSALYLLGYCGAAIPGMLAGRFVANLGLFSIAIGYMALGTAGAVVAILASRPSRSTVVS